MPCCPVMKKIEDVYVATAHWIPLDGEYVDKVAEVRDTLGMTRDQLSHFSQLLKAIDEA